MNLSHADGVPPSPEQGEKVLRAALDAGVTLFNTTAPEQARAAGRKSHQGQPGRGRSADADAPDGAGARAN